MLSVLSTAPLVAGTIYTTLGPGDTYGSGSAMIGCGNMTGSGGFSEGRAFTPASTQQVSSAAAAVIYNTGANPLYAYILADAAGAPGTILDQMLLAPADGQVLPGVVYAASTLHPTLEAGTTYWFVLAAQNPLTDVTAWYYGAAGTPRVTGAWREGAGAWHTSSVTALGFRLDGVPEPSSILLGLSGLLLCFCARRLRRD